MEVKKNVSLKDLNTFGIDIRANAFIRVTSVEELQQLFRKPTYAKTFVLGGGSNVLFTRDFNGLVIQIDCKGREIIEETEKTVTVRIGAGENWHQLVTWAVDNGYEGIENMALIPGTIGGAVVGNIAAYGQNISDVLVSVTIFDMKSRRISVIFKNECELHYRSSIFKRNKNLIVIDATCELRTQFDKLETSYHERKGRYGSLEEELLNKGNPPYTMKDVYDAVIRIRQKKLPNPENEGTVGSFFVNPLITKEKYVELSTKISELQSYPAEDLKYTRANWQDIKENYVKIPAGRLLDELGWRGKWEGNVGVSSKHALCVVTNKRATGDEVLQFVSKMKKSVRDAYGLELESEVDIV